jgi:hypothetical protein
VEAPGSICVAVLLAVNAKDGTILSARPLGGVPGFDAIAAAGGRLYVAMQDGRIVCLAKAERIGG